jgi:hypothetical protein
MNNNYKRIYKIPVGNLSAEEAKKCLHTMKKSYQQTIAWSDTTPPLTMRTYYIKLDGLKPKITPLYKLSKYSAGTLFVLELNTKLFDRLKKINRITKTINKEVEFINKLLNNKIDIMEHLRSEMVKATKIPKSYIYPVDHTSLLTDRKPIDKKILDKFNKIYIKIMKGIK